MKACDDRIAQLVDAASDGASPEFAAHLARCAGCRSELDSFRATTEMLERTRDEPADLSLSGFAHRVTDAAELRRDGTWRGLWRRLAWKQRLSLGFGGAACAALGAAFVLAVGPAPGVSPVTPIADAGSPGVMSSDAMAAPDVEALLLAWDEDPLPTLDDGLGDLTDDDIVALSSLLSAGSGYGFGEETL